MAPSSGADNTIIPGSAKARSYITTVPVLDKWTVEKGLVSQGIEGYNNNKVAVKIITIADQDQGDFVDS